MKESRKKPDSPDSSRRHPTLRIRITGKPKTASEKPSKPTAFGVPPSEKNYKTILRVKGGEKYKVGPIVAEGGMGVVHEAMDLTCKRIVAIKELPRDRPVPPEDLTRFIEEAQITSQLEHPNIVPIHELGFDVNQNAFYSMKYVKGLTLTDVLLGIRNGREDYLEQFPLSRLLNVFQKVCDAVAFAHSRGIVHCDLKPDNIMICDFGEVMVMDWGLARRVGSQTEPDAVRSKRASGKLDGRTTGRILGTPGFIAPERLRCGPVSTAFDVYSLGATLYGILALRPPITGGDTKDVLRRILDGNITPAAAFNDPNRLRHGPETPSHFPHCPEGRIPVALSDIAMKAMSVNAAERYATVQDFQQEIEAYQNGRVWHLVLDQDFSGPNALANWEVAGGHAELRNGELRMSHGEPQLLVFKGDLPGDVRIEFECRQETVYLNALGCFLSSTRTSSPKEIALTGYKFEYGGFDNSANTLERAGRQLTSQPESSLERGRMYRVRAERTGQRLRFVVNDKEVFNVLDHDPLSGADRTAIGLFGWLAETVYTKVKIYTLGTPWKSDILDIAERQSLKGNYAVAMALLQEVMDSFPDPARMERARQARETALRRERMMNDLCTWKEKLRAAWPMAKFDLRAGNEGFSLDITDCGIDSLEPLRGLSLTSLVCPHNRITSLEPLRGMPLMTLNCIGNPITSLEPLRGAPLNILVCEGCPFTSLEPLRGAPITLLNFGGARVEHLDPLRGMPLTFLCCWGNRVRNLEPLRGMKSLAAFYCNSNQIESLEPLRGLPIVTMNCSGNRVADLEPLRGMPLGMLHCGDNRIESLEPLRGIPLKMLSCQSNRIRSLAPLEGAAMASLVCGANRLDSLDPFLRNPPDDFRFDCDTLSLAQLKQARDLWARNPGHAPHFRNVSTLIAIRESDVQTLRKMAASFGGHHYLFIPKFLPWADAKTFCETFGGHLITINSREENDFLNALFPNGSWFWMGLTTGERGHEWVTGEPFSYSNFVDLLQERKKGPKVFSGRWTADDVPNAHCSFLIEWDD